MDILARFPAPWRSERMDGAVRLAAADGRPILRHLGRPANVLESYGVLCDAAAGGVAEDVGAPWDVSAEHLGRTWDGRTAVNAVVRDRHGKVRLTTRHGDDPDCLAVVSGLVAMVNSRSAAPCAG